jgi:hypothetical protein
MISEFFVRNYWGIKGSELKHKSRVSQVKQSYHTKRNRHSFSKAIMQAKWFIIIAASIIVTTNIAHLLTRGNIFKPIVLEASNTLACIYFLFGCVSIVNGLCRSGIAAVELFLDLLNSEPGELAWILNWEEIGQHLGISAQDVAVFLGSSKAYSASADPDICATVYRMSNLSLSNRYSILLEIVNEVGEVPGECLDVHLQHVLDVGVRRGDHTLLKQILVCTDIELKKRAAESYRMWAPMHKAFWMSFLSHNERHHASEMWKDMTGKACDQCDIPNPSKFWTCIVCAEASFTCDLCYRVNGIVTSVTCLECEAPTMTFHCT